MFIPQNSLAISSISSSDSIHEITLNENNTIISFYLERDIQFSYDSAINGLLTIPAFEKTLCTAQSINITKYSYAQSVISMYRSSNHPGDNEIQFMLNEVYHHHLIGSTAFDSLEEIGYSKFRVNFWLEREDYLIPTYIYPDRILTNGVAMRFNENSTHIVATFCTGFNTYNKYLMYSTECIFRFSAKFVYNGDSVTIPVNTSLIPIGIIGDENADVNNVLDSTSIASTNFIAGIVVLFAIPVVVFYFTKEKKFFILTIPCGIILFSIYYNISFVYWLFIVLGIVVFYIKNQQNGGIKSE